MRILKTVTVVAALVAAVSTVWAQAAVTAADLTRLETTADEVGRNVAALRKTDPTLAETVDKTLAELRDEITYLKVKMRKDGSVTRADYADVRDRLETLRLKSEGAQGSKVSAQPMLDVAAPRLLTVDVGTQLDTRLQTPLNSGAAKVEQRFETTTILDFKKGNDVLVPAGTLLRGFVSSVRPAGKLERKGSLTLSFDEMVLGSEHLRLRASVTQTLDGKMSEDATRVGAGAVVGAIIGGIIGGGKGALIGVLVGGGGTMASTEGSDVDLPVGTILRIRVDQPVSVTVGRQ